MYATTLEKAGVTLFCAVEGGRTVPALPATEGSDPRTLLHRCMVPSEALHRSNSQLRLVLMNEKGQRETQTVDLKPAKAASSESLLGICLSPIFGVFDKLRLLEWRIHHAQIGFEVVHFYDRENADTSLLRLWVAKWNLLLGTKDTWRHAPALVTKERSSLDTLHKEGAYADQVGFRIANMVLKSS